MSDLDDQELRATRILNGTDKKCKKMNIEEAYNTIKKSVEAINTRPYATKAEYEKVECIKILLTAYEKEKEKNKEIEERLSDIELQILEEE